MLKGRMPLILAGLFALLAGVVAFMAVQQQRHEMTRDWDPHLVVVAKQDLRAGDTLRKENIDIRKIPKFLVTKSVITQNDLQRGVPIVGQKLAIDISKGDPLLFQHIQSRTGTQHLAETVLRGGRAVSIRVSPESAVHHWLEPSDQVDVIGIFTDPTSHQLVSVTMLQNVIILATGRIGGATNRNLLTENEKSFSTVTLQVVPEAVEMLVLAQELGTLYLSLRGPTDNDISDVGEGKTTMQTLLTGERSKRISAKQTKMFRVIDVYKGGQRETQVVP